MSKSVSVNLKVNGYTNRVLGVVKEKYGFNDKGEALNKFAEMYGDEFVEKEVKDEIVKEIIDSCNRHMKKYGFKSTTIKQLRKEIEGN